MMRTAALAAAVCAARPGSAVADTQPMPPTARPALNHHGIGPEAFDVVEKTLPNGLKVRLLRETSVPTVTYYTFFKVGSRNEQVGITGISHLFEHMMFNGSEKFGPKEFDRQLESRGGYSNAYTSSDVTAYYEDFDREALSLVVDLESDRMRALRISDEALASEREVVKEERRFRVDNDIGGTMDEQLDALAFFAHPYHWPVIGWMGDIERINKEDCETYFRTYYAPNNAVLVVVGDFDIDATMKLIEDAYGSIPAGPPIPAVAAYEPEQKGERRGKVNWPAQTASVLLGYKAVSARHEDAATLDVIQAALSIGEGARLERTLVRGLEVVTGASAWFEWRIDPGLFKVHLDLAPGASVDKAIAALDAELGKLHKTRLSPKELARAKNILRGQTLRSISTHNGRAHALGEHEVLFGDWRAVFETLDRYEAVTAEQVQAAARRYLVPDQRTLVELVPTED